MTKSPNTKVNLMPALKKEVEENILDAALSIFSRKGLMGARMVEIAKEADITRASLNYYFRSKEQLYQAVIKKGMSTLKGEILASIHEAEHSFEGFTEAFIRGLIQTFRRNPDLPFFMINIQLEAPEPLIQPVFEELDPRKDLFAFAKDILLRAIQEKKIKPIEPIHFMESLISLCAYPFLNKKLIIKTMEYSPEQMDQFYLDRIEIVTQLMINGYVI